MNFLKCSKSQKKTKLNEKNQREHWARVSKITRLIYRHYGVGCENGLKIGFELSSVFTLFVTINLINLYGTISIYPRIPEERLFSLGYLPISFNLKLKWLASIYLKWLIYSICFLPSLLFFIIFFFVKYLVIFDFVFCYQTFGVLQQVLLSF